MLKKCAILRNFGSKRDIDHSRTDYNNYNIFFLNEQRSRDAAGKKRANTSKSR